MTFDQREKAFENKFALDSELAFRAEARTCKLLGLWMAGELGLTGAEAETYAKTVVAANLDEAGFDDVKRFVMKDIMAKGLPITESMVNAKIEACVTEAQKQILAEKQA